jgi:hypothetical protein
MSRPTFVLFLVGSSALAACGGGGDPVDPNAKPLQAWSESGDVFTEQALDVSCFHTPSADVAQSAATITLNTKVTDFQTDAAVPGAMVTAFAGTDQSAVIGTGTSTGDGTMSIMISMTPAHTRFGFKMTCAAPPCNPDFYDTFLLNQYLDPAMPTQTSPSTISTVSKATGAAIPALVGISRTTGTGVLAGALRDCQLHELSNFTATVSDTPGEKSELVGARTFYFQNGLPARNTVVPVANKDGLFAILELPPTQTAYVQMWGYLNQADLDAGTETLLSELAVPVIADNMITGSYELERN